MTGFSEVRHRFIGNSLSPISLWTHNLSMCREKEDIAKVTSDGKAQPDPKHPRRKYVTEEYQRVQKQKQVQEQKRAQESRRKSADKYLKDQFLKDYAEAHSSRIHCSKRVDTKRYVQSRRACGAGLLSVAAETRHPMTYPSPTRHRQKPA
jgi:hypothetical protein